MQSKELKERLANLQQLAEEKAYNELVKDVTKHSHDEDREYFSSYKNSLGFGKYFPGHLLNEGDSWSCISAE